MRRLFWVALGATAGALVVRKISKAAQAHANGRERLACFIMQITGYTLTLGLLRAHHFAEQFRTQLLTLLRLM